MEKLDGRKLDHKTREAIRIRAIQMIESGESPEVVVKTFRFHRSCVYAWLARYNQGGIEALKFRGIPGRQPSLSGEQLKKLYSIVAEKNPLQLKFEFALWTRSMVRRVIIDRFKVTLSESQVGRLLRQMGMSPQRPLHRAYQRDPERVAKWLNEEYPAIRALAKEEGAQIFFGDEAGVRSGYHSGTTWGPKGETPIVETTGARFGVNLISAISSKGQMRFMLVDGKMTGANFIKFLKRLIDKQNTPVFLIVDGHPAHKAKAVTQFIASTNGQLRLYHLPPYSPDLNPDELVWNHVKNHKIGREAILGANHMKCRALSILRSLQKVPAKIKGFFRKPSLCYAAA